MVFEPPSPSQDMGMADPALFPAKTPAANASSPDEPAPHALAFTATGSDLPLVAAHETGTTSVEPPFPMTVPRRTVRSETRGQLFVILVLIPLISYAVMMTALSGYLFYQLKQAGNPMEYLPDDGDFIGGKHHKQGALRERIRVLPESELPEKLKVALGQALRVGDLEVTPQKVELRRVKFLTPDPPEDPAESLVLHLLLRNVSRDVVFSPTDPFFDRRWRRVADGKRKPFTFLQMGSQYFYGGPLPWTPTPAEETERREPIAGQVYQVLQPGEQMTTLVCTNPDDRVRDHLEHYQGECLWRVQVRRGLVKVGEREVSATAVVGVRFRDTDIRKPEL
jgi:hypothetical protein